MKHIFTTLLALCVISSFGQNDWQNTGRYEKDNMNVLNKPVAVFMGNSITDNWARFDPEFFSEHNFIGRGISGQVTSQMLVRFRSDVINLSPKYVVILAGINDIAQNQGYISVQHIFENIVSMAELARCNKIKPVLCTLVPADIIPWNKKVDPKPLVAELNALIRDYAKANKLPLVDYFAGMTDQNAGILDEYRNETKDAVHPGLGGYKFMEAEVLKVLK